MSSILRFNHKNIVNTKPLLLSTNSVNFDLTFRYIFASNHKSPENYYQVLGVEPKCDKKVIRLAYLKLCKRFHPDLNQGLNDPKLEEFNKIKLQDINKAYNCLIKEDQRLAYDQFLREKSTSATNEPFYRPNNVSPKSTRSDHKFRETHSDFENYYEEIKRRQFKDIHSRVYRGYYHREGNEWKYTEDRYNDRYYGFKTTKRATNTQIVMICMFVLSFGFGLHTAQYMFTKSSQKRMENLWKDNGIHYKRVVSESKDKTNRNIKRFEDNFKT